MLNDKLLPLCCTAQLSFVMCLNTVLLVQTSSGNLQRTAVIQEVLDVLLCSVCRAHSFSFVPWSSFHRRKPKSNSRLKSDHFTALQATDQHNVTILCVITFIFSHVQQRRNFRRLGVASVSRCGALMMRVFNSPVKHDDSHTRSFFVWIVLSLFVQCTIGCADCHWITVGVSWYKILLKPAIERSTFVLFYYKICFPALTHSGRKMCVIWTEVFPVVAKFCEFAAVFCHNNVNIKRYKWRRCSATLSF